MRFVDKQATEEALKDKKYHIFIEWLKENGAKFDKIQFPSVFAGGLMGLSAKNEIPPGHCFISIPNKCIISV